MTKASTTEQSHSPGLCTGFGTLGKTKASGAKHQESRQRGEGCSHEVAVVVCTYDKPRVPDIWGRAWGGLGFLGVAKHATPERVKCLCQCLQG